MSRPPMSRPDAHPDDPRALIAEAYRIEGLHEADARSIFFDWALGLPAETDPAAAAARLTAYHDGEPADHPMSVLLREAAAGQGSARRRGGRRLPEIREAEPWDGPALEGLYRAAFPEEDLVALVLALLRVPEVRTLVAGHGEAHAALSPCRIVPAGEMAWLLGPVAVAPARQGRGIGRRLMEAALGAVPGPVLVLGDPAFYGRFGFAAEAGVAPPYPLPEAWAGAWQSVRADGLSGRLEVSGPWADPALWAP